MFESIMRVLTSALDNQYIDPMASGSERSARLTKYEESLELIDNVPEFDALIKAREQGLTNVKIGDKSLTELKLAALPNRLTPECTEVQAEFKDLNDFLANPEKLGEDNIDGLIGTLHEYKPKAIAAFTAQQAIDLAALEGLLNNAATRPSIAEALGIAPTDIASADNPKKIDDAKAATIETFKKSQQDALETFKTDLNQKLTLSHQQAQKERDRVFFLATLYENSAIMRKEIEKLEIERDNKRPKVGITISQSGKDDSLSAKFAGIDPAELKVMYTVTGRKMTREKDGSISMTLPNYWLGVAYHGSARQKMLTDMTVMALAVRATGSSQIQFTIDTKNPKAALEQARAAYEAARLAGYEDKDIKITFPKESVDQNNRKRVSMETYQVTTKKDKDTGKELMDKDDKPQIDNPFKESLFNNGDTRYDKIEERVKKYDRAGKTPTATSAPPPKNIDDYKEKIKEYRAELDTKAAAKAAATPPPVATRPAVP